MNPLIQCKTTILPLLVSVVLACFGLPKGLRATDLDGVLPGGNNADGFGVLTGLTTGGFNTGNGWFSLHSNAAGNNNTAVGAAALFSNGQSGNTAVGAAVLFSNTSGNQNTANGAFALFSNTDGFTNTANGYLALFHNVSGHENTANGAAALNSNTTGSFNTANGDFALANNTTGTNNTALGASAGINLTTGSNNVCIGAFVTGVAGESNTTRIGNVYSSVASDRAVYVNSDNKIGTLASSRRFKEEIKPMEKASEVLFALKPVSFRYKKEFDTARAPMFGLIAEDVERVDPGLVSRNEKGEVDTVRYEQINAMLLNEFLKEHRKNEEQQAIIAQLKKEMETVVARLKEHDSKIQRVSTKLR